MRRSSRKRSHPRDWIVSIMLPDNAHPVVAVAEVAFFAAQPSAERDQLLRAHGSKSARSLAAGTAPPGAPRKTRRSSASSKTQRYSVTRANLTNFVGDLGDPAFLATLCKSIPRIDFILDDASHVCKQGLTQCTRSNCIPCKLSH